MTRSIGTDPNWDWRTDADDTPERLLAHWQNAVDHSRSRVRDALANGGLDQPAKVSLWPNGARPSMQWIICHMLEEYARHNGHADLLRESVDGQTGE